MNKWGKKYWSGTNSCVGIHAQFQVSGTIVRICFHILEIGLQTKIYMLCLPAVLFLYTKQVGKKILELDYDLLNRLWFIKKKSWKNCKEFFNL